MIMIVFRLRCTTAWCRWWGRWWRTWRQTISCTPGPRSGEPGWWRGSWSTGTGRTATTIIRVRSTTTTTFHNIHSKVRQKQELSSCHTIYHYFLFIQSPDLLPRLRRRWLQLLPSLNFSDFRGLRVNKIKTAIYFFCPRVSNSFISIWVFLWHSHFGFCVKC